MTRLRGQSLIVLVMLACAACAHGPWPDDVPGPSLSSQWPLPPSRTVSDVFEAVDADATHPHHWARELVAKPPPADAGPKALADFYNRRGGAWGVLGAGANELADLHTAIRLAERKDFLSIFQTAVREYAYGNYKNAVELLATARPISRSPFIVDVMLAWYAAVVGDLERADDLLRSAEAALETHKRQWPDWDLWQHNQAAVLARTQYFMHLSRGNYAAAEAAARRTLRAMADDEAPARTRRARGWPTASEVWERAVFGNDEHRLAQVLVLQGKLAEAEVVVRSSLRHHLANKASRDNVGRTLISFARLLVEQGRFAEAEGMARRAIETFERIGSLPQGLYLNEARQVRAEVLVALGRGGDALAECERRRDGLATDPDLLNRIGAEDLSCAIALLRVGTPGDAKAMLETLRQRASERFGSDHYAVHELDGFLGVALMDLGDQPGALARFRAAFPGLLTPGGALDRSPWKTQRLAMILEAYIGLLYELRTTPGQAADALDAAGEAFAVADIAHGQSIHRAVAAAAVRAAAVDRRLASLVRREQDLANESSALYDILRRLAAAPSDQQPPAAAGEVRARIDAIVRERQALAEQIARAFPDYANLRQPRPVTLGEARSVLAPGEVMLSILVGAARTFVWAVPRDGPVAFYASALTRDQVAEHVATLRASLDVGAASPSVMPEFDTGLAHRLYRELLGPGRTVWKDAASLLVVTSGPLSQLPLAVLPTEPVGPAAGPVRDQGHAAVPWLVRQLAVVQVPSANSLVALRAMPSGRRDRKIFVGFGDPLFGDGAAAIAAGTGAETSLAMRNLSVTRATSEAVRENKPVRWTPYSHLPPLPDTREEVLAIARALGADPGRDVFLGREASRDTVRRLDLTSHRILAFATHGLLPGDFRGIEQPALALAAPLGGGADTNPRLAMLTLDDVLSLKLDADLVVLSACNSAAGDGRGSDAISGLGRGFFYAGSRALLVTHWPVESRSARLLVTGIFERYVAEPSLSRAEALRQSMLSLMDRAATDAAGTPVYSYAHPMFWAPFALVGDPGPMSSAGQAETPPRSATAETP